MPSKQANTVRVTLVIFCITLIHQFNYVLILMNYEAGQGQATRGELLVALMNILRHIIQIIT